MIANNFIANNGGYGVANTAGGDPEGEPVGTVIENNLITNNGYGAVYDTGVDTVSSNNNN